MRRTLAVIFLLALLVSGCSRGSAPAASDPDRPGGRSGAGAGDASANASPPAPARSATPSGAAERVSPVSLPALFAGRYDGRRFRLGRVLVRTDAYTQRAVTYRSNGLRISGVMSIPEGSGRFPLLVLAHGYIDPAVYVTGQGLRREQDWLARAGYAVLHVDYRNHAGSSRDPKADERLRIDYAVDVVNAVHALRRSGLQFLDLDRTGLLGRSMGGGVVYNVLTVAPGLVDAAVVYAPVSSRAEDNFDRWIRHDPNRAALSRRIIRAHGAPEQNQEFWREVSSRTYFGRVTEPVLIQHGTADESCPIRWSRQSLAALKAVGVEARMFTYPGEPHAFDAAWPRSMRRTVRFFEQHLG